MATNFEKDGYEYYSNTEKMNEVRTREESYKRRIGTVVHGGWIVYKHMVTKRGPFTLYRRKKLDKQN